MTMRLDRWLVRLMVCGVVGALLVLPSSAQTILSNNSGTGSTPWAIQGEPSLVMNGFDLTPLSLPSPVIITAVTISVAEAVPGQTATLVVYTDSNGGSPVDATLAYQTPVTINTVGQVRVALPQPVTINAPVIWVGFYLPVGFEFNADTSGASVLTYWGWTPGGTFDVANLSSAQVFGPSDGTAPVNLNIGGVARITVELNGSVTGTAGTPSAPTTGGTVTTFRGNPPLGLQIAGGTVADSSAMVTYPYCGDALRHDQEDINVTGRGLFQLHCRADIGNFAPGQIRNLGDLASDAPNDWTLGGILYDISATGSYQTDARNSEALRIPVTHCLRPQQAELNTAVVAIAYGAPRVWEILPTVRYGEQICAEVDHIGFISYLVPQAETQTLDANLQFSGTPKLIDPLTNNELPLVCGVVYTVDLPVFNEGFDPVPSYVVRVQNILVRTGEILVTREYNYGPQAGGTTQQFTQYGFTAPLTAPNETHRLVFTIDPRDQVAENNREDNTYTVDYMLVQGNKCR